MANKRIIKDETARNIFWDEKVVNEAKALSAAFHKKGDEFSKILKMGRTEGQDAVPMTVGQEFHGFCAHMYGDQPDHWDDNLSGYTRLRVIINAMTRMRVCTPDGKMNFTFKGMVRDIPNGYVPWFETPNRASSEATVIFGHWSALGLQLRDNLIALDTGCLWGGALTAIRLEDRKVFQVPCGEQEATGRLQ